jgi:Flp pilus assembly protein TadD
MAYSCANVEDDLAEKLYLKLIQKEPANAEALNDIGLMYEKKTDYAKAKFYFSKAYMFCDTNKTYKKNLDRVISKK